MDRRDATPADPRILWPVGREPPDANGRGVDAERRGDDPLDEGVLSAALLPHAGPRLDRPIPVETQGDRRAAAPDVPHAEGEADPAPGRTCRRGVDLRCGTVQERAQVRAVPGLAGRGDLAGPREVAPSHLERCDPELPRDEVEMRLRREDVLRLAGRAHVPAGHLIRVHGRRFVASGGHAVALEGRDPTFDEEPRGRLPGGVRAPVEERVRLVRDDAAVGVDAGPQPDARRMTRVRRRELVRVSRHRPDRPAGRLGEVIEDELVRREALTAEVAADRAVVDVDPRLREAERRGHLVAQVEGGLVRGHDAHPIPLEPHHRRARLERGLMDARRGELVLKDAVRSRERRVHLAMRLEHVSLVVRVRDRGPLAPTLEESVRRRVGMQDRGIRGERGVHVEQRGQLLVLDVDEPHGLVGDLARVRRDRGDPIADEEDVVPAQHRPVLQPAPEALPANVRARQDRAHARERACPLGVDGHDAGVRVRAAHERGLQRAGDVEVRGVRRRAGRLRVAVDAPLRTLEELGAGHRAATLRRRHSANPASTLSAWRAMSGWPSSPMRPRIATSLDTRSSVGASPVTARSTNARTAPPIR